MVVTGMMLKKGGSSASVSLRVLSLWAQERVRL